MSWWTRIKAASKRLDRAFSGHGEIFNTHTYMGNLRVFLYSIAATYFLWHLLDLLVWWDGLWGVLSPIDLPQQRWTQLWALIIGGTGVAGAIMGMIAIPLNRYRARKSAKHQWYDKTDLTKEDVQGSGHGNGNSAKHNG